MLPVDSPRTIQEKMRRAHRRDSIAIVALSLFCLGAATLVGITFFALYEGCK